MKPIFVGRDGVRAGWLFALFLIFAQLIAKTLFWVIGRLGYQEMDGWTARGFIVEGAISAFAGIATAALLARFEKRSLDQFGFRPARAGLLFLEGVVWGLAGSVAIIPMIAALGGVQIHGLALHGTELWKSALVWWLAMMLLGLSEEFLFRGYPLVTLARGMGFWPAALLLSALFGGVHYFFKPMETWIDGVSVGLYGLFWCLTFRRTGSLWFAIGFHAMSDYADMVLFAEPNSGNKGLPVPGHLLDVSFRGPSWLTGGPCGTEASALVFLILAALFFFFDRRFPRDSAPELSSSGREAVPEA
ncbi:MAG TPA: type II CAAX endopeptidase family protein [Thermoanaerobaculia bacterium]